MLDHIEIYVRDIKNSKKFYSFLLEYLGYEIYQQWTGGFSYKKGDFYIVFVQVKEKYLKEGYNRCHIGLNHLAFSVNNIEKINLLRENLKKKNIKLLYDNRFPYAGGEHHYALYFEDLEGIKIEVVRR